MKAKYFGNKVLVKRKELKLNQQELADLAGVSRNYVSMIERGEAKNVSREIIRKLANSLQVPIGELTGEPDDSTPLSVPPALRRFAIEEGISYDIVDRLVQIPFRGQEPETAKEWAQLYEAISPFLREED